MTKLTTKQNKFVKAMASGLNAGDAAIKAGYNDKTYGYHLKKRDDVKQALLVAFEKAGVNEELIAQKIKDGMEAMTVPKHPSDDRRFEDHFVRKQFTELAIKVRGDFAPEKVESVHRDIRIVIDGNLIAALKDSRALSQGELDILDAEIVEEINGRENNREENKEIREITEGEEREAPVGNGGGAGGAGESNEGSVDGQGETVVGADGIFLKEGEIDGTLFSG